jgi:hypothetical protein
MREWWRSVAQWAWEVSRSWFAIAVAGFTGLVDVAHGLLPHFDVSPIAFFVGYGGAFVIANIQAFHHTRMRLDVVPELGTNAPADLADSLAEGVGGFAAPTSDVRLRALGIVNPLVGHFQIRNYASPVDVSEPACVIRVVLA